MFRFASILVLFAACAADVGSDSPGGPDPNSPQDPNKPDDPNDPTGGSMTPAEFLTAMGRKDCDDAFACKANFPTDAGVTFAEAFGADANACYADAAQYYDANAVQASITAGKITFSGSAAKACVDGFKAPTCSTYWTQGPDFAAACETAMVGKVATGGACTNDFECASSENWCDDTTKKCAVPPQANARAESTTSRYVRLQRP